MRSPKNKREMKRIITDLATDTLDPQTELARISPSELLLELVSSDDSLLFADATSALRDLLLEVTESDISRQVSYVHNLIEMAGEVNARGCATSLQALCERALHVRNRNENVGVILASVAVLAEADFLDKRWIERMLEKNAEATEELVNAIIYASGWGGLLGVLNYLLDWQSVSRGESPHRRDYIKSAIELCSSISRPTGRDIVNLSEIFARINIGMLSVVSNLSDVRAIEVVREAIGRLSEENIAKMNPHGGAQIIALH